MFHKLDNKRTFHLLIWPSVLVCLLPPILQMTLYPASSPAHNIATFLTGKNDWRLNPVTTVAVMAAVVFILITEAMVRIRIRLGTSTTTDPNGRNINPIKNMTVIQGISVLLFSFLQMTTINVKTPLLVFPRILLGAQSTLMFALFFLWSEGARSYAWTRLSWWRIFWLEVREGGWARVLPRARTRDQETLELGLNPKEVIPALPCTITKVSS